ncbi:hypothetical protein [Micromonospora citrea]|uniref:hypothetical protein n=1 Tax=Micromonospora citrea TaxID=47855 RepID=UPI00159F2787|nr:hypothetical protein [Micromonospora citrea]
MPDDGYRFGEGPLTLRVTEVLSVGPFEGRVWAEVRGHEVTPDGTLRSRARFAFVRLDRVRVVPPAVAAPAGAVVVAASAEPVAGVEASAEPLGAVAAAGSARAAGTASR